MSHLLQRITHAVMTDGDSLELIEHAGRYYARRNTDFAAVLTERGLPTVAGDGMSLWVELPVAAAPVAERLTRRGWLVRTGGEFSLEDDAAPSRHLRLTVHDLDEEETDRLATDIVEAASASA